MHLEHSFDNQKETRHNYRNKIDTVERKLMTKTLLCIALTLSTTAHCMEKNLPQELIYAIFDFLPLKQTYSAGYTKIYNPNRQLTLRATPAALTFLNDTTLFPGSPLHLTRTVDLQQVATSKKVLNIVSLTTSLLEAPWQNFKNLKKLIITIEAHIPSAAWFEIIAANTQLTSFTIRGIATEWDLVHQNLQEITWHNFTNLKELNLSFINIDATTLSHISEIKSLQSLKAHACIPIIVFLPLHDNWWTKIPWQNFANLIHLDLTWCDAIDDNVLRQIAQHCKNLTSLRLVGTNFSPKGIILLKNCASLKTIQLFPATSPHEKVFLLKKHHSYHESQNISAL
jgi:hypothetical protein